MMKLLFLASVTAVAAQDDVDVDAIVAAAQQATAAQYEQHLAAAQEEIVACKTKLANFKCPVAESSGGAGFSWSGFKALLSQTYNLQKSLVSSAYGSVIKPHHEELVYATVAKAQVAASDGLVIGKAKVFDLYEKHLSKHYEKHGAKHVNKATGMVSDHVENVQNLYTLHAHDKIEMIKEKVTTGASVGYVKVTEGFVAAQEKFDAFLAPKVNKVVTMLPAGHGVPEGLHDRLFFFALFFGFTALVVFITTKVAGKVLCVGFCIFKTVFGIVWYFVTLPLRILTCQVCKKRATGPKGQTFSKPPGKANGNGARKGKK